MDNDALRSFASKTLKHLLELIELDRTGQRALTTEERSLLAMLVDWHRAGS